MTPDPTRHLLSLPQPRFGAARLALLAKARWGMTGKVTPPDPAETALLPDLLTARLMTTRTISASRAARYPKNARYVLRNAPISCAGLAALGRVNSDRLADQLHFACERPAA